MSTDVDEFAGAFGHYGGGERGRPAFRNSDINRAVVLVPIRLMQDLPTVVIVTGGSFGFLVTMDKPG